MRMMIRTLPHVHLLQHRDVRAIAAMWTAPRRRIASFQRRSNRNFLAVKCDRIHRSRGYGVAESQAAHGLLRVSVGKYDGRNYPIPSDRTAGPPECVRWVKRLTLLLN